MVGRVGLFRAWPRPASRPVPGLTFSCPPPRWDRLRSAATFKFAPGELVEPTTIGLKVQNGEV